MPRGGRGGNHSTRKPVDLTGVLALAEKNDLITLTSAVTEKLLSDLCVIFDSPTVSPVTSEPPVQHDHLDCHGHHSLIGHHWLSRASHGLHHLKTGTLKPSNRTKETHGDDLMTFQKAHAIVEKEEQEAMTPQLRELKKEATTSLKKWQALVLLRMRDMFVTEPEIAPRPAQRGRGRGGLRGHFRGRGGRGGTAVAQPRPALTLATGPPRVPTSPVDLSFARKFPPIPNTLWPLAPEKRKLMLHIVLLLLLSHQEYSSHSRLLLLNLTSSLNISLDDFQQMEFRVARALSAVALDTPPREEQEPDPEQPKTARRWKFGLGTPGTTGALAEPLAAAGICGVHDSCGLSANVAAGLLGSLADSGYVVGSLFGMNATRPASKSLETYAKEVPDFGLSSVHGEPPLEYPDSGIIPKEQRRLRLVIGLNGWLTHRKDLAKAWKCLGYQAEAYVMRWEMNALLSLGSALQTVIKSTALKKARAHVGFQNIRLCLHNSQWPDALLKMSKIIDNSWSVGMVRAEKTGATLADAIMRSKFQGDRPISLIGFSLGARAIYTCLMVLAERRCFGLIDSVVMMGSPVPSESRVWLTLKSVISGRLVNVYSENDYILGFLCRTSNTQFGIAGLEDVQGAEGVENFNVSRSVDGHLAYQNIVGQVLQDIGWEDLVIAEQPKARPMPTARARRR